jgi:hypothetical protein
LSFPKSEKIWNVDTARHGFHPIRRAGAGRAARPLIFAAQNIFDIFLQRTFNN